uniref:Variant surface glycoprotein n=1 Tax=Trypanosoma congolense (strain IL3000) TaxID=1068625 RepID=G0UR90_TRYCI|nr:hypothetical protein, unlikely [Trypanosoma congolense IL3000]
MFLVLAASTFHFSSFTFLFIKSLPPVFFFPLRLAPVRCTTAQAKSRGVRATVSGGGDNITSGLFKSAAGARSLHRSCAGPRDTTRKEVEESVKGDKGNKKKQKDIYIYIY